MSFKYIIKTITNIIGTIIYMYIIYTRTHTYIFMNIGTIWLKLISCNIAIQNSNAEPRLRPEVAGI